MRQIIKAAVTAGLLTAALTAGCSAGVSASPRPTVETCYAFGVQAIQRHIKVVRIPQACAGLSHEEVNQAVGRAVQEEVGRRPKPAARRQAAIDSRYLANLVRPVRPPSPAPPVATAISASSGLPVNLAAPAAWIVTAAVGSYLLAGLVSGSVLRRRGSQASSVPRPVIIGHAGLGMAGLFIWIAFVATGVPALAWAAAALILAVAGLGMAALITAAPEPSASASGGRPPVVVIAFHGVLATATMLLVLLAAIGAG
jgi:hypothetical protein